VYWVTTKAGPRKQFISGLKLLRRYEAGDQESDGVYTGSKTERAACYSNFFFPEVKVTIRKVGLLKARRIRS